MRPTLLFLVACVSSMAIAYGTIRLLLRDSRLLSEVPALTVEQANALRSLANEQLTLSEQLESQADRNPSGLSDWSKNIFLPALHQHHNRLKSYDSLPAAPVSHLQEGLRLLEIAARAPRDEARKTEAVGAVHQALAEVERYVEHMRVRGRLSEPKRRVACGLGWHSPTSFAKLT